MPTLPGLPVHRFGTFPTPVEEIDLSRSVPSFRGRAWVKREDLSADLAGGNKVRKLEYLFGAALARRARALVTTGGLASNHCFAAAYHGRRVGLEPYLVLFPQRLTDEGARRFRANCALAAGLAFSPWATATPIVAAAVRARLAAKGLHPYAIPPGGSSVLGAIGFANAGLEIAEQVASGELEPPDVVFAAASSGGTAAGLALGLQLAGLRTRVVAVPVYPPPLTSVFLIRQLARRAHRRLSRLAGEPLPDFDPGRVALARGYLGSGYGEPTAGGSAAIEVARDLGLALEMTYTAKAFAAFLDAAGSEAHRERRLLFLLSYDARTPEDLAASVRPEAVPPSLRRYL